MGNALNKNEIQWPNIPNSKEGSARMGSASTHRRRRRCQLMMFLMMSCCCRRRRRRRQCCCCCCLLRFAALWSFTERVDHEHRCTYLLITRCLGRRWRQGGERAARYQYAASKRPNRNWEAGDAGLSCNSPCGTTLANCGPWASISGVGRPNTQTPNSRALQW